MAFFLSGSEAVAGSGTGAVTGITCSGLVPQGDLRCDLADVDRDLAVEHRVGMARERAPVGECLLPQRAGRRKGSAFQVFEGLLVGRDHADLGAKLDREIADREPAFDLERANGAAGIFHGITRAPGSADLADQVQDHVLGRHARMARALEGDAQALGLALDQRLRRQHMDHLGGADAEGDGAHAAMRAGVAVAAHQQGAGQGNALLGPDDVDDALAGLTEIEELDAPALGFAAHVVQPLRIRFQRVVGAAGLGRDDMVEGGEGEVGVAHRLAGALDHGEAAAAAVMHQMAADVQERVVVAEIGDDMAIPDLVEQGLSRHGISFRRGRCRAAQHPIIF
jgi:hypothetical protein